MTRLRMEGDRIVAGKHLTPEQRRRLADLSVPAADIVNSIETLNSEIEMTKKNLEIVDEEEVVSERVTPARRPTAKELRRQAEARQAEARQVETARRQEIPVRPPTEEDFSADLANLKARAQAARTETVEEIPGEEEPLTMREEIMRLLRDVKGAPNEARIQAWKAEYGDNGVYCIALGEGDVYIFTYLRRVQWHQVQDAIQTLGSSEMGQNKDLEDELKQKVLSYCVLWPRPLDERFFYNSRGGVIDRIFEAIMMNSYFLNPQQTMMLTTQL